jgi:hypothetical protein
VNNTDCNDAAKNINTTIMEICNNVDDNCDGKIDENLKLNRYYVDMDNDGYGNPEIFRDTCITIPPSGFTSNKNDCNDNLVGINPGQIDIAGNKIDEDCNGVDLYNKFETLPNPFNNYFEIRVPIDGTYIVELYNQTGALIYKDSYKTIDRNIMITSNNFLIQGVVNSMIYIMVFDEKRDELLYSTRALKL